MAQTESQVAGLELERVLPDVPTLFDRDGTFFKEIERRPVEIVSKRDMRIPLELRPGGSFGHFDPDGGDLGRGDGSIYDKATITPAFLRFAVEFTTLTEWVTDDKRKAVLNSFRQLLAKSMAEFRRQCDSLTMTSGNGVVGTITSVVNAGGKDTYTLNTDGFGVRLLRFGQKVSVYSASLLTNRNVAAAIDPQKIDLMDIQNKQVRTVQVAGAIATDVLVVEGLTATPPSSIKGVKYHDDNSSTGTWLGFDRSTTPEIRANRSNGNNQAITLPLPRLAINKIGDRIGMDNMNRCQAWMHPSQVGSYEQLGQLITVLNQTPGESKGLDLYYGGSMQMAGAPVKKHFSWDKTRIDFVDLKVWGRAVMKEATFYEREGKRIFEIRGASGGVATSNIFYIVAAFDLFMNNPAGASYIDSLKIPSGY